MGNVFGDLERLAGDLYPYRWPIGAAALAAAATVAAFAYRRGWHLAIRRHPRATALAVAGALAVLIPLGSYTLSPLWTRTELQEPSPLVALAAEATAEAAPAAGIAGGFAPRVVATGTVQGADAFHTGEGAVAVIETAPEAYTLRFEAFSVRNGPDLYVYLSPAAEGYADGALNLGRLKATDGAFNYAIPAGTDLGEFQSVIVWCKRFTVLFATATLTT